MDFNFLKKRYWLQQVERVEQIRQQIANRMSTAPGRVVPDAPDLTIGSGRRLKMAIMFLDICDFSSLPSEHQDEQEQILATLNLFFTEMIRIVEDCGGTVEKNTGDGLMAYFEDGGTDPPEDGTHRAIACSLTMMAACEYLINPILLRSGIPDIKFRICIDYGTVTIARLGAAKRFNTIVAIGTTANVASKMLSKAKAGDILLGSSAKYQLPESWQQNWTEIHTIDTGWVYRLSKVKYMFYRYTGRWSQVFD